MLTNGGMEANEACALSLRVAAGMADPLISVPTVREALNRAGRTREALAASGVPMEDADIRDPELALQLEDAAVKVSSAST
jgi:hypothetical protein